MRPTWTLAILAALLFSTRPAVAAAQEATGLELAVVIPITSPPLFAPGGSPAREADVRLADLAEQLQSLTSPDLADIPIALAPNPVFCDELQWSGSPAAQRVRSLMQMLGARYPLLSSPYAEVRLPRLTRAQLRVEVAAGRRALRSCAGVTPIGVLHPPDLQLDEDVLDALNASAVNALLGPADRIAEEPSRIGGLTAIPAETVSPGASPNDAVIRFRTHRAAVAIVPPDRADLITFIAALANDPRIELRPVTDLVGDAQDRSATFPPLPEAPDAYDRALEGTRAALARFRSYILRDNRLAAVLRTTFARARGSAEWNDRWSVGRRRAAAIIESIRRQQRLITIEEGDVTFTSRRGSVPVTVRNGARYPVRVRIALASPKLEFPDARTRVVTVDPPGDTIVVAALARSTGTFPVQVQLTSSDRSIRFDTGELTVRSVAANVSALVLTGGGALFLVGWYARRVLRRRRAHSGTP
jgi:hypothetical protein